MSDDTFDWQRYIKFAKELLNDIKTKEMDVEEKECKGRNIISRAYYGAYCLSRNFAQHQGWVDIDEIRDNDNKGSIHKEVAKEFTRGKNFLDNQYSLKLVKKYLGKMRRIRNNADYEDIYSLESIEKDIEKSKHYADSIVKQLSMINDELNDEFNSKDFD